MFVELKDFPGYWINRQGHMESTRWGRSVSLKTHPGKKDGYYRICLRRDGKSASRLVHRLVAETFIGPIPDGLEVNHIDGDKSNNHVSNLEYVTRHENIRHARALGLYDNQTNCDRTKFVERLKSQTGENNPSVKLTDTQIVEIKALQDQQSAKAVARMFDVSDTTIRNIWAGRRKG